jgi:hypothetical protein
MDLTLRPIASTVIRHSVELHSGIQTPPTTPTHPNIQITPATPTELEVQTPPATPTNLNIQTPPATPTNHASNNSLFQFQTFIAASTEVQSPPAP